MRILPNVELSAFGIDPWWITLIKVLVVFVTLVVLTLLAIWGERRIVARMQMRVGPNRVGPGGVLIGLMDGVKLALKEENGFLRNCHGSFICRSLSLRRFNEYFSNCCCSRKNLVHIVTTSFVLDLRNFNGG